MEEVACFLEKWASLQQIQSGSNTQSHICIEKLAEQYLSHTFYGFKLHTKTHKHITRLFFQLATKFFSEGMRKVDHCM